MGELVIKHFRRADAGSRAKELITEIVVEGSETGRFLQRMEETRLTRPCFQTIDMRGRVAGECRRYAFNDRVHFLDDISFEMFEKGLLENNGVYTVGTFEAIMGGSHTLQGQAEAREQHAQRIRELERRRLQQARELARELGAGEHDQLLLERASATATASNPALLALGYFRKRAHPRLQYACAVTLTRGNISVTGTTRDISVGGMRVQVRGLTVFKPAQDVAVGFGGLLDEQGEPLTERVLYRVVSVEAREAETVLGLRRRNLEKPPGLSELLQQLVERRQRKYKLDMEDEYRSVLSGFYERSYAQSSAQVPFFIASDSTGDLHVQAVAMSDGNAALMRFFCTDADNYNFTPLCLAQRLQRLAQGQTFVLAMYRQRGGRDQCRRIHSAADFESASPRDFRRLLAWALRQSDYCIVRVQPGAQPLFALPSTKVGEICERLQYKSETRMVQLQERLQAVRLVGFVSDITQACRQAVGQQEDPPDNASVWVGGECRRLDDASVVQKSPSPLQALQPELIRFGYVERRREDRYLAETRVEVCVGDRRVPGLSQDISTCGMRIRLDARVAAEKGVSVRVGLVSLQQKKASTNLMDIPYRVVEAQHEDAGSVLRLERVFGGKHEGLKEFFVELITKNQHKLGVDLGDLWGATTARIYESLMASNVVGIPLFIGRSDEGGAHLQFVGVPETACGLAEWLRTSTDPDLRWLNQPRLVTALYDAIQIVSRQARNIGQPPAPFELEMYLYRGYDQASGEVFIHAVSELDFNDSSQRQAFLDRLVAGHEDWRCLKLTAGYAREIEQKTIERMLGPVRTHSRHRALKLSDLFQAMVGYAELVDITPEWLLLRSEKS